MGGSRSPARTAERTPNNLAGTRSMTKPTVYVETSIVSYLTARPWRDLIIAAQQAMTREWWRDAPERFVLVASELVLTEAAEGDTEAAGARLTALEMVTRLDTTEDAAVLTRRLLEPSSVPPRGGGRRGARQRRCHEQGRLPPVVESPPHRQCRSAGADRASLRTGLRAADHLHAQ